MEHFENLKVGDWVVVTGHRYLDDTDEEPVEYNMFGGASRRQKPEYNGVPTRIMAVAFPFICVANNVQQTQALDMRVIRVNKVSLKYVKAMIRGLKQAEQQSKWTAQNTTTSIDVMAQQLDLPELKNIPSTEGNIAFAYPKTCPVCHNAEMKEILTEGEEEWKLICESCGFTGTRPNKGGDSG